MTAGEPLVVRDHVARREHVRRVALALALVALAAVACTGGGGDTTPSMSASSRPTPASPKPKPERWTGAINSTSYHRLYVGGTCTTDWRTKLAFTVADDGTVVGAGTAKLTSKGNPCPFPIAQLQIQEFALKVTGEVRGGNIHLQLTGVSHRPSAGADDLGGFRATVLAGAKVSELLVHPDPNGRTASARLSITVPGPDRDEFGSTNTVGLRQKTGTKAAPPEPEGPSGAI